MTGKPPSIPLTADEITLGRGRRLLLAEALAAVECDLPLATFCWLVFDRTRLGKPGEAWRVTMATLAKRPHGLCCRESRVRTVIEEAITLNLVQAERTRDEQGIPSAYQYSIDWAGVEDARKSVAATANR